MKIYLSSLTFLFILMSSVINSVQAQKVYSVDYANQADVKYPVGKVHLFLPYDKL